MLEETPSGVYIQDRGLSRWDTCAAQAVLEAHGGCLYQLRPLAVGSADAPPQLVRYTYAKGAVNADFAPGVIKLNKYNAAAGVLSEADTAKGAPKRYAESAEQLKPYSNCLGLFALKNADEAGIAAARAAILKAAATSPPEFD